MIRVFIADDHLLFRQGLISLLEAEPDLEIVGEASDGLAAVRQIRALAPDVVLMDVHMPHLTGTEAARMLLGEGSDLSIIMLTVSEDDEDLFEAVRAGACGYLVKNIGADDLIAAIRRAHAGEAMLSPAMAAKLMQGFREADQRAPSSFDEVLTDREHQVLAELTTGATNREIAERLFISEHTVKTHVRHILNKLGLENRAQAAACAVRHGLVPFDSETETDD